MTQQRIIDAGCNEVADLMEQIKDLPDFALLIVNDETVGFPTLTREDDKPEGVSDASWQLVRTLRYTLDTRLISASGQNSKAFYDLSRIGYQTQVLERDSFGPLACAVYYPNNTWRVVYG